MNTTLTRESLLHQLNWRYATKEFDLKRKISPEDWAALEAALVLSPSSAGLQPWKFIVVTDPAVREQLASVSYGQRKIAEASHLVVFAAKKYLGEQDVDAYLNRVAEVRGVTRESLADFRAMIMGGIIQSRDAAARRAWATNQVYIALGNFLTSAAVLGIDACPMEGFQPDKYDEILGLDKLGVGAAVVATAGYRAAADKYADLPKVRFARKDVILEV